MSDLLLGIDVGTTRAKAVVFDLEGKCLASQGEEYGILTPKPTWAEHDPSFWWMTIRQIVRRLFRKRRLCANDVRGLGVSVLTPALVPVDKDGRELRNAILMIDQRAVGEAEFIRSKIGEEKIFEVTGNRIAPGAYAAPSVLWIKRNEPKIYKQTNKFLHANGYLVHKMTGTFSTDYTQASSTLLLDIRRTKSWDEATCNGIGIELDKLPEIHPSWQAVGDLTSEAAQELGLKPGIPVVAGANDTACSCVGTGVVEEGMVLESIGTTITFAYITNRPEFDLRVMNRLHAVPDRYILLAAMSTPGAAYRWLRDHFYGEKEGEALYETMDKEAEGSPPGANGLVFMPYLSGERTPIWNPNARGVLFGLTLSHSRADVARAFLEGGAYCVRDTLEVFKSRGLRISEVRVTGGGAKSAVWRQIMADVLGLGLRLPKTLEASCLGAAILGGTGARIFRDPIVAANSLVKIVEGEEPRLKTHKKYQRYFRLFARLYQNLVESFEELASLEL